MTTNVNTVSGTNYYPPKTGTDKTDGKSSGDDKIFDLSYLNNNLQQTQQTESPELTALKQERSQLEGQYQQLETQQKQLQSQKDSLEARRTKLEKKQAQVNQKIQNAEERKAKAQSDVQELTASYNSDKQRIIELAQEAQEQISQLLNETEKQKNERLENNKETVENIMKMYEEGKISKEEVGTYIQRELVKDTSGTSEKLQGLGIIDTACAEIKGLSSSMTGIYDQIASKETEIRNLTLAIADYEVEKENIDNELVVVKSDINDIIPSLNSVNKQMSSVQKEINKVDKKIAKEDQTQQASQVATGSTYYKEEQLLAEGEISHSAFEARERLRDNPFESIMPTNFSMQLELILSNMQMTKTSATEMLKDNQTEVRDQDTNAQDQVLAVKPKESGDRANQVGDSTQQDKEKEKYDEEELIGV